MLKTSLEATVPHDSLVEGAFKRSASGIRHWVAPGSPHPPASGRYVLYVSLACPWASRCVAVRAMKGLEGVVELVVSEPVWGATNPGGDEHRGWLLPAPGSTPSEPGATPDPVFGARSVRAVYEACAALGGDAATKFTVPLLVDRELRRVVNNESSEILRMLNSAFNDFASNPSLDLYPAPLRAAIDGVNERVYDAINDGVCEYRRHARGVEPVRGSCVHAGTRLVSGAVSSEARTGARW